MSKETKCPICDAREKGSCIPGVTMLQWECGNTEDLLEWPKLQPDACRIRQLESLVKQHQDAWTKARNGLLDAPGGDSAATKWAVALIDYHQPLDAVAELTECEAW